MSRRYATIKNEQADGTDESGTGGQREAFKKGESDLGISSLERSGNLFPNSPLFSEEYNPEESYKSVVDGLKVENNPDFIEGVNLNFTQGNEEPLLQGVSLESSNDSVSDKPQYGAPNITTPDVNNPLEARERTSSIEQKEAGFGVREINGENVHNPVITRERIGKYFTENSRRSPRSLGTSKPTSD